MKSQIKFAEEKLKESFEKLKDSKTEDKKLYEWINRALNDLEENAFCGIRIQKRLIPKVYIEKYEILNTLNLLLIRLIPKSSLIIFMVHPFKNNGQNTNFSISY